MDTDKSVIVLAAIDRLHILIVILFVWRELLALVTRAFAEHQGTQLPKDPLGVTKTIALYVRSGVGFVWIAGGTAILGVALALGLITGWKYISWWRVSAGSRAS